MDNKTNYCVIDIDKYEKLIYDNIELNEKIKEINEKSKLKDNILMSFENYFIKKVIQNESYNVENFKEYNDYHYKHLFNCFREIGIDDSNYIDSCIVKIKEKYENKGDEKHGN